VPRLGETVSVQRKQNFIDAAWRCAARRGFRELTVDEICSEAGTSKGAFYGYFDSKQDLQLALLAEDAWSLDAVMEDLERSRLTPLARIRAFVRAALTRSDDGSRVQVRADLWADMLHEPKVRARFVETMDARRATLRRWIDECIAAGELPPVRANALAAIVLALSDGLMLHGALNPSAFGWPNVRQAIDALLFGLSGEVRRG
jgi:AcrR family transcriptional regulator